MSLPPYLLLDGLADSRDKSRRQERRAAKDYGGVVVAASGAGREKGDVNIFAGVKLEAKRTDKRSISLRREWLDKISSEAWDSGRIPAIELEFGAQHDAPDLQWVAIEKREFIRFLSLLRDPV